MQPAIWLQKIVIKLGFYQFAVATELLSRFDIAGNHLASGTSPLLRATTGILNPNS